MNPPAGAASRATIHCSPAEGAKTDGTRIQWLRADAIAPAKLGLPLPGGKRRGLRACHRLRRGTMLRRSVYRRGDSDR